MNFGETVKEEIFSRPIKDVHCRKAFLAGLVRGNGVIFEDGSGLGLSFKVAGEERCMTVVNLIKTVLNVEVREVSAKEDRLNRRDLFEITLTGEDCLKVLKELEIIKDGGDGQFVNFDFYGALTEKDCCFRAFIRGLFVSCGSCTIPEADGATKTGYHLEIAFSHGASASKTADKLLKAGITGSVTRRREKFVYYIKSTEGISDFIAFLPAPVSVLKFTDVVIERGIFNKTNRVKNCDLGNLNRQVEASAKIIGAIEILEKNGAEKTLKPDLLLTLKARKDYPDDTLSELAERLNVTKSCLNHRLRKLVGLSEKLTEKN